MNRHQEHTAITRLRQGDIRGLEALVHAYQVRAIRAAALITRDQALAEDIVQSAFIRAFERIHQFDTSRPFAPWFLRSVVNDAVKAVSRGRPQVALDDGRSPADMLRDPAPGPDTLLEQAETEAAIVQALAQLPPEQRGAVILRYYLGLSEAEIAAEQDSPPGTVKWRLHAARKRLRHLLTPWRAASRTSQPKEQTS